MTKPYYPPFNSIPAQLEITSLKIEKLNSIADDFTKKSGMKNDLILQDLTLYENFLSGTIKLLLRNQIERYKSVIFLQMNFSTPTNGDDTGTFCEVLKYLYEWTAKNVKDCGGHEFKAPQFPHSKESFAFKLNNFCKKAATT